MITDRAITLVNAAAAAKQSRHGNPRSPHEEKEVGKSLKTLSQIDVEQSIVIKQLVVILTLDGEQLKQHQACPAKIAPNIMLLINPTTSQKSRLTSTGPCKDGNKSDSTIKTLDKGTPPDTGTLIRQLVEISKRANDTNDIHLPLTENCTPLLRDEKSTKRELLLSRSYRLASSSICGWHSLALQTLGISSQSGIPPVINKLEVFSPCVNNSNDTYNYLCEKYIQLLRDEKVSKQDSLTSGPSKLTPSGVTDWQKENVQTLDVHRQIGVIMVIDKPVMIPPRDTYVINEGKIYTRKLFRGYNRVLELSISESRRPTENRRSGAGRLNSPNGRSKKENIDNQKTKRRVEWTLRQRPSCLGNKEQQWKREERELINIRETRKKDVQTEAKMKENICRIQSVPDYDSDKTPYILPAIISPITTPVRQKTPERAAHVVPEIKIIPLPDSTPTYAAAARRREQLQEKRAEIAKRDPRSFDLSRIPLSARNELLRNRDRIDEVTRVLLPEARRKPAATRKQCALLVKRRRAIDRELNNIKKCKTVYDYKRACYESCNTCMRLDFDIGNASDLTKKDDSSLLALQLEKRRLQARNTKLLDAARRPRGVAGQQ